MTHRTTNLTKRDGVRGRALALLVGVITVGAVVGAGEALANPGARSDHSNNRGSTGGRDTTGWHHIDPFGYHHTPQNSLRRNEQQNNLREYRSRNESSVDTTGGRTGGATTWTRVPRPDGNGWTVCRAAAGTC
ncbi:hypothetical protein ACW2Q0_05400 [Nocardia sp. R16R-3T]